jgi:hypothetical protein
MRRKLDATNVAAAPPVYDVTTEDIGRIRGNTRR